MRKMLLACALLCAAVANAATTVPSSLINWASPLAITNGGTGAATASAARTALGLGTSATVNTGTSGATIPLLNGTNTWASAQTFSVRPTFNGATPYDTGNLTIANYAPLASPTFTGTVIAPTIKTTAMSRVKASTTNAQSIPNNAFTAVTTWTTTQNQGSNFVASTGVYTVPVAGDYDVRAGVRFTAATGVIGTQVLIAVAVNGTNVYQSGMAQQNTSGFASQAAGSWLVTCNAGDTITIRAFQNSGAAMTLDGGTGANYVQISQVP